MKRFAIILLALALPLALYGANGQAVIDGYLEPAGYVQLTSVVASSALTSIPNGVKLTMIQAEGQDIRWRDDGNSPTTTVGMVLAAGQTITYNGNPAAIRVIEVTTSAKVNVSYYK